METVYLLHNHSNYRGSYPTYEEWKQRLTVSSVAGRADVLILPMRNGNRVTSFDNNHATLVLILPMRNGNFCLFQKFL